MKNVVVIIAILLLTLSVSGESLSGNMLALPANPAEYASITHTLLWQQISKESKNSPEYLDENLLIKNSQKALLGISLGAGRIDYGAECAMNISIVYAISFLRFFSAGVKANWISENINENVWQKPNYDIGLGLTLPTEELINRISVYGYINSDSLSELGTDISYKEVLSLASAKAEVEFKLSDSVFYDLSYEIVQTYDNEAVIYNDMLSLRQNLSLDNLNFIIGGDIKRTGNEISGYGLTAGFDFQPLIISVEGDYEIETDNVSTAVNLGFKLGAPAETRNTIRDLNVTDEEVTINLEQEIVGNNEVCIFSVESSEPLDNWKIEIVTEDGFVFEQLRSMNNSTSTSWEIPEAYLKHIINNNIDLYAHVIAYHDFHKYEYTEELAINNTDQQLAYNDILEN